MAVVAVAIAAATVAAQRSIAAAAVVAGVALADLALAVAVASVVAAFRINNLTVGLNPSSFGVKHLFCGSNLRFGVGYGHLQAI